MATVTENPNLNAEEGHAAHTRPDEKTGLPGKMPRKINVTMIGAGSFFTASILKDVT